MKLWIENADMKINRLSPINDTGNTYKKSQTTNKSLEMKTENEPSISQKSKFANLKHLFTNASDTEQKIQLTLSIVKLLSKLLNSFPSEENINVILREYDFTPQMISEIIKLFREIKKERKEKLKNKRGFFEKLFDINPSNKEVEDDVLQNSYIKSTIAKN